jgi:hypothetical protein
LPVPSPCDPGRCNERCGEWCARRSGTCAATVEQRPAALEDDIGGRVGVSQVFNARRTRWLP